MQEQDMEIDVVVFGGRGYLGSVVCDYLSDRGLSILSVDMEIYGKGRRLSENLSVKNRAEDFRDPVAVESCLSGASYAVHLGGFVGEPACDLDPALTYETNRDAPALAAQLATKLELKRFVFASTCSVYGTNQQVVDESSDTAPLSHYAKSKIDAEKRILALSNGKTRHVVLRFGTAYGLSPRPRLDSVVNAMSSSAATKGALTIRGGTQWRPLVHIEDIAQSVYLALTSPRVNETDDLIFNVGSAQQNVRIAEIADEIRKVLPHTNVERIPTDEDQRDYQVSFAKIVDQLGFKAEKSVVDGIREIVGAVTSGAIQDPSDQMYNNYEGLKSAIRSGIISPILKS